jgi:hypothetical protein
MPSEEEEMSFTKWRNLLGTELMIALQELAKIHKDGANKRHQHYVESCAEQYWKIIASSFNAATGLGTATGTAVNIPRRVNKATLIVKPNRLPFDANGS